LVVTLFDVRRAGELKLDRAHADGHATVVSVVPQILGELRPGQAGGHLWDVVEELPYLLDGLGDIEAALDKHQASCVAWSAGR